MKMLMDGPQFASPNTTTGARLTSLVRYGLALLLFAAALSKATYPSQGIPLEPTHRLPEWLNVTIILFECLLAVLLLSGLWQRQMMGIALTVFVSFAAFSLYQVLTGADSCGCFGAVRVSPWMTFVLDLGIIVALCFARPKVVASSKWSTSRLATALGAYALIVAPLLVWMHHYAKLPADDTLVGIGRLVILYPETWPGKPFPLLQYIDTEAELAQGDWVVLLHRHDCGKCIEAMSRYAMLAEQLSSRSGQPAIALVELPPFGQRHLDEKSGVVCGRLRDDREWFVETPAEIRLQNGVVQRVSHDLPTLAELDSHTGSTIKRVAFDP